MTTWKKSGETSAKTCRKKEATSTSPSSQRYLAMAPANQLMSKRRVRLESALRRAISTIRPSHTSSSSACVITRGRAAVGSWTRTLPSSALTWPISRKPPSRRAAITGRGVWGNLAHWVRTTRVLSPNSLPQRTISATPTGRAAKRCRIWSPSAATPCRRISITRAMMPGSLGSSFSGSMARGSASACDRRHEDCIVFLHAKGRFVSVR